MGDKDKTSEEPSETGDAGLLHRQPFQAGYKRDAYKKEGAKGEKAWGNRRPEPKDPTAPKKGPGKEISVGPLFRYDSKSEHVYGPDFKAGEQDKTFVQALRVKTSNVEFGSASVNLTEAKGKLVLAKTSAQASVVHGEVDLAEVIGEWLFGKPEPQPHIPAPPSVSMAPFAARVCDLTTHGSPLLPGPASPNVFIGGMPAWRCGVDLSLCPFPGASPHGTGPTLQGEPTVLVNGLPAARMGDFVAEPTGGPNVIISGCTTVMIGTPAPPPPPAPPALPEPPKEPPWVVFGASASGDMVHGDAKLDASAEWDAKKAQGKVEVSAGAAVAMFKGKLPLQVKIRIPHTDSYLGLGLTVEASALSLGAEGGLGGAINKGGRFFKVDGGAKVGAGLFGLGAKFSVDIGQ